MDTTVTGIFPDHQLASLAVAHLQAAGFPVPEMRVIDADAYDRHEFVSARTADTMRGWQFGIIFGPVLGLVAGVLLSGVLGLLLAIAFGALVGIVGGTILGLLVGRATTTQIKDEIEHQIDSGAVLVSVNTDAEHSPKALEVLARDGAVNMVSTAASFRAGVLPITQPGFRQQEIPPKTDARSE